MSADTFQVFPERVTQQPWEREGLKNGSPAWPQLCFSPLFLMCKIAVPGNNRFFCILLTSVYDGGKTCHLPDGNPTHALFMLSGEAKQLKLTSSKVPSTLPHSRGEECMWNWPPQLLGSWEKRKKLGKLLSKWKHCEIPALPSDSALLLPAATSCTLEQGGKGGGEISSLCPAESTSKASG